MPPGWPRLPIRITLLVLCHWFCGAPLRAQETAPQAASGEVVFLSDSQATEGPWRRLRGQAEVRREDMILRAEEIDYHEETGEAEARGKVHFSHLGRKEDVYAERVNYNLRTETGTFYQVHGTVRSASQGGPRVLTTDEPFYFQGEMAQKVRDHYTIYRGFVTNCKPPTRWWTMHTPKATIVPDRHAVLYRSVFKLLKVPLFYAPIYYKSLERMPRSSGFLTPNIGNSSRRGRVLGEEFFWAINRSYDMTLGATYFSSRGLAHQVTARGRPTGKSHFDAYWFAMNDRGLVVGDTRRKQGGRMFNLTGRTELPRGFQGVASINYLSSLEFRSAFTETFNEAIFSEVHSVAFVTKTFSNFFLNAAAIRNENFQTTQKDDTIVIRKFPSLEFNSREHELVGGPAPVYLTLDTGADLLGRSQPGFRTSNLTQRLDFYPRVSTRLAWKGFRLFPTFGARETYYGEQLRPDRTVAPENFRRGSREFTLEFTPPALARLFDGPKFLADRVKHVIEPKATYRYVTGVPDFRRVLRFDERDLLTNTNEVEWSVIQRLYGKRGAGEARELVTLEVWQRRYLDPTFGGALVEGQRNVFASTVGVTPFAFADTPRRYSPVVSMLRLSPRWNWAIEWRTDYDPRRQKLVNSGLTADANFERFNVSLGHYAVRSATALSPNSNQLRLFARYGALNKRGWNTGFTMVYDYRIGIMQWANTHVTYNTDCCGFSVEWRRFALGATRNENQFRLALSIANVGSFGTLKKQERIF